MLENSARGVLSSLSNSTSGLGTRLFLRMLGGPGERDLRLATSLAAASSDGLFERLAGHAPSSLSALLVEDTHNRPFEQVANDDSGEASRRTFDTLVGCGTSFYSVSAPDEESFPGFFVSTRGRGCARGWARS